MQLVSSLLSLPSPHYTPDKLTSSLRTLISVSEIKNITSIIIWMGQILFDYRYMEPFLEVPITGKLVT
jgi:hypothetical protein